MTSYLQHSVTLDRDWFVWVCVREGRRGGGGEIEEKKKVVGVQGGRKE